MHKLVLCSKNVSNHKLVAFKQPKEGEIRRCKIYDWTNEEEEVIAEGLLCSSNARELVNNIPLGPNAVSIEVVKVFNDNAHLWRPTADMFVIGDAINEKIAWPVLKFEVMATAIPSDATPSKKKAKKKAEVCFFLPLFIAVAYLVDASKFLLLSGVSCRVQAALVPPKVQSKSVSF